MNRSTLCRILLVLVALALAFRAAPGARGQAPADRVLILADTVFNGSSSAEYIDASQQGYAVDVIGATTWLSLRTADFAAYRAIILGDPYCGYDPSFLDAAERSASVWGAAVNGNVVIVGTDLVFHRGDGIPAAGILMSDAIAYAAAQPGRTGAYISLSCYYESAAAGTHAVVLDALSPGGFSVHGTGCYSGVHLTSASPVVAGLDDAALSGWSCSTHEGFDTWPPDFQVAAIALEPGPYTAPGGINGLPYIITRGAGTAVRCDHTGQACTIPPHTPVGAGRIDYAGVVRQPVAPYTARITSAVRATDDVLFSTDRAGGIGITLAGITEGDAWTFKYFQPGHSVADVPDVLCVLQLLPAGAPGNPATQSALVSGDCQSSAGPVLVQFPGGCAAPVYCTTQDALMLGPALSNSAVGAHPGQWLVSIDFAGADHTFVEGAVIATVELQHAPLVLAIHGMMANCESGSMTSLAGNLRSVLAIPDNRVACFDYDWKQGVYVGACVHAITGLNPDGSLSDAMRALRRDVDPGQPIDIVAHSLGGLVARYYIQATLDEEADGTYLCHYPGDPVIRTVSMLGTPNTGERGSTWVGTACASVGILCKLLGVPQGFRDLSASSDVISHVNGRFGSLPGAPAYFVHVGRVDTDFGTWLSGDRQNDCVVGLSSAEGPVRGGLPIFSAATTSYVLSHASSGWPECTERTLTDDPSVAQDVADDIKAVAAVSSAAPAARPPTAAQAAGPPVGDALLESQTGVIQQQGNSANYTVTVPPGLPEATIAASWPSSATASEFSVAIHRPNGDGSANPGGPVVAPGDVDVLNAIDTSTSPTLYLKSVAFDLSAPLAGDWTVTVTATTAQPAGLPHLVTLTSDSAVQLTLGLSEPRVLMGAPELITSTLLDNDASIPATSATAQLIAPDGSSQIIDLHDDGVNGDVSAGDHIYSASFAAPALCGGYQVKSVSVGVTSEGNVARMDLGDFAVHVAGDAAGDPCNADDDGDGITDADEMNRYGTGPLDRDTDGDGLDDGAEIAAGTDPLIMDTDADLLSDGAEVNTYGSNPLVVDTDADGCADGEEAGSNASRGGLRDPVYYWDFYDVGRSRGATSAPGDEDFTKDGKVNLTDQLIILDHFGHNARDAHDHDLDRLIPDAMKLWRTAENPSGDTVDFTDVLNNQKSFGHDCTAPP